MASVLVWLVRVSAGVVKWAALNPLKALATALTLKVSSDYVRKQPWAGSKLVADMLYGAAKLYAWPAVGRIAVEAAGAGGKAVVEYIIRLLGGGRDRPISWSPWGGVLNPPPFDVTRVVK